MDIKGKKIMVIGGAGFIGSHVVEELIKEDVGQVVIYDNFLRGSMDNIKTALEHPKCYHLTGDIESRDGLSRDMSGFDAVIHLAARWLLDCHEYPYKAFYTNIQGTFNVLQACVYNKIERLIFSSSASVYGNALYEPMDEEHPYNNETFYGATKIAGEHMFKTYQHRYGLNGVALRYMNVYGPRQHNDGAYTGVITKVLDSIEKGERPVIYGDGEQAFDFIYVTDVARANVDALKSDVSFGFYNVGTGWKISINTVVDEILRLTDSGLRPRYDTGMSFVTNRVCDPQRAFIDLGFAWDTDLTLGLRRLIEWRESH